MKKGIIILVIFLVLGFIIGALGYFVYNSYNMESEIQEAQLDLKEDEEETIKKINYEDQSSIYSLEDDIKQTSMIDEKVSPDATLIIKKFYKDCGHTTKDYATVPEEIVNKTEQEVKDMYSNWEIKGFSPDEIVLYKELDGICNEHYVLKELDGVIAVYTIDSKGEEKFQEKTGIAIQYLPEQDFQRIQQGSIKAVGKEELNGLLEDYE